MEVGMRIPWDLDGPTMERTEASMVGKKCKSTMSAQPFSNPLIEELVYTLILAKKNTLRVCWNPNSNVETPLSQHTLPSFSSSSSLYPPYRHTRRQRRLHRKVFRQHARRRPLVPHVSAPHILRQHARDGRLPRRMTRHVRPRLHPPARRLYIHNAVLLGLLTPRHT